MDIFNYFRISINELRISINELWISINELWISLNKINYLYNRKNVGHFCQGDYIFQKRSCMIHSSIGYRLCYAQTLSSRGLSRTLISIVQVASWFDSVFIRVACCVNFRKTVTLRVRI